jgi:hypothetical protein
MIRDFVPECLIGLNCGIDRKRALYPIPIIAASVTPRGTVGLDPDSAPLTYN